MVRIFQKIKTSLLSVPLHVKILGLALGLIILFGSLTIVRIQQEVQQNIRFMMQKESRFIASELSFQVRDFLLINDLFGLTNTLKISVQNRPNLRYAFVIEGRKNVLAHTFGIGFPVALLDVHRQTVVDGQPVTSRLVTDEGIIWDTWAPIFSNGDKAIRVGVTEKNMHQQLSHLINALIANTVVIGIVSVFLSLFLTWIITWPVKQLLKGTRQVEMGDYSVHLVAESRDEVGRLIEGFNAMVAGLKRAELARVEKEHLQRDFLQQLIAGQENERKRIARELHDQTGQALASFMVELKVLERAKSGLGLADGISRLKNAIIEEMDSIHNLAVELRPSVLDDLGLVPAINMYVKDFQDRYRIETKLTIIGFTGKRAEPPLETCVYRIIQEALINCSKHAKSTEIKIILEWRDKMIRGIIEDNGCGFNVKDVDAIGRMGLYGMQERAQLLNGSCSIESDLGVGTMVQFTVPVTMGNNDEYKQDDDSDR